MNEGLLRTEVKKGVEQLWKRRYLVFFCNLYLMKELTAFATIDNPSFNWVRMEAVSLLVAFSVGLSLVECILAPTGWLTKSFSKKNVLLVPLLLFGCLIGGDLSQGLSTGIKAARIFAAMIPAFLAVKEGPLNPIMKPESISHLFRNTFR